MMSRLTRYSLLILLCAPALATPFPFGGYMLFDGEKATEVGDGIVLEEKDGYRYAQMNTDTKKPKRLVENWDYIYEHENLVLEIEFIDAGTTTITPRLGVVVEGETQWHTPVKQSNQVLLDSGMKRRAIFRFEDMPADVDGAKIHLELNGVEWVHRVRVLHDQPSRVWGQFARFERVATLAAESKATK